MVKPTIGNPTAITCLGINIKVRSKPITYNLKLKKLTCSNTKYHLPLRN